MSHRNTAIAALILASLLQGCATGFYRGENLITTYVPTADDWVPYRKVDGNINSLLWKRKSNDRDQYFVTVIRNYPKAVADFRTMLDTDKENVCVTESTAIIDDAPANGYDRLIWKSRCALPDGTKSTTLHLALRGKDSFYHVMKRWVFDVPDSEVEPWIARLKENTVCDTRDSNTHPCPEGFKKAE